MRTALALLLAAISVAVVLPGELLPAWARWRTAILPGWPLASLVSAAGLAAAAGILGLGGPPARRSVDHTGLTVGLLFLLEPVLHLGVLVLSANVATIAGAEALLPLHPPAIDGRFLGYLLVYSLVVPIAEELFFRGSLLPWLQRRVGAVSAVSLSALCFAVAHGDLVQACIAAPVGLLLGTMRVAGADLGACILAHAVHNSLFLCAGAGLVAHPLVAPILVMTGVLLIAFAWFFHLRPRPGQWRRFVVTATAAALVLVAILPTWRSVQDRLWVAGVHRLCRLWRVDNEVLLARLVAQERGHRLDAERRRGLVAALIHQPCQTAPRQTAVLALLDPDQAQASTTWEDDAYELLCGLAVTAPPRYDGEIARRLGACFPEAFADACFERPEALARWLPLPERTDEAALLIAACTLPRDRRALLVGLEHTHPGAVAAVILAMPPDQLGPIEARHLRSHYPDWERRLAALADQDASRALALGFTADAGAEP